jgi:hypothetical protein
MLTVNTTGTWYGLEGQASEFRKKPRTAVRPRIATSRQRGTGGWSASRCSGSLLVLCHAVLTYGWSRGTAPHILNLCTRGEVNGQLDALTAFLSPVACPLGGPQSQSGYRLLPATTANNGNNVSLVITEMLESQ